MIESKVCNKYYDLYNACSRNPEVQLHSNGNVEEINFNEKEFSKLHPENGFYEKFVLTTEERVKVKRYRARLK